MPIRLAWRRMLLAVVTLCAVTGAFAGEPSGQTGIQWASGFPDLGEPERVEVLEALWRTLRYSECTEAQVEPLLAASRDVSYRVRGNAVRILAMCGETSAADEISARWHQMFDDSTEKRRIKRALIGAMGSLGVADEPTLNRLTALATHPEDRVFSQSAVAALGVLGAATDPVLEAVLAKLEAGPRSPRVTALVALKGLTESLRTRDREQGKETLTRVIAAVIGELPAEDIDVNQQAALFLGGLGPRAAAAVPALVETFRQRAFSRSQVAYALGEIGPTAASAAVPLLEEALRDAEGPEKDTFEITLKKLKAITA